MDAKARRAWSSIRRCVEDGRYLVLTHFMQRMDERGLVWPDVLSVLHDPTDVRDGGPEQWGRPKWIVEGQAADGHPLSVVCVLDRDEQGRLTVFITAF